jgi:hypothetical protein
MQMSHGQWMLTSHRFAQVVLADFGESRAFGDLSPGSAVTTRNRGTECVKSPEMLLVANARKTTRDSYDRRKREGAGLAILHAESLVQQDMLTCCIL